MKSNLLIYLKKFIIPALIVLVLIASCVLVIFPKIKTIMAIREKIKIQENDIKILTGKINQLNTLSEAELVSDSQILMEYFPQENDIFNSIMAIRQLTKENGININEFSVSPGFISSDSASTKDSGLGLSSSIKMEISGTLENQKIFLTKMEKIFPLMGIEGVEINSSLVGTESGQLSSNGDLTVNVYFKPVNKKKLDYFDALPKISAASEQLIEQIKSYEKIIPPVSSDTPVMVGRENLF